MPTEEALLYRLDDLTKRMQRIEDLKPDVLVFEVGELRKDVKGMKTAFYTFAFGTIGSSVVFAFGVFALLGKA